MDRRPAGDTTLTTATRAREPLRKEGYAYMLWPGTRSVSRSKVPFVALSRGHSIGFQWFKGPLHVNPQSLSLPWRNPYFALAGYCHMGRQ